jgi:C_GCAxxG_C_C family probable redox protein
MENKKAAELFGSGYNCAQAVVSEFCSEFGIDEIKARAMAAGFGAGIGRSQELCGALSGAIMVLGLRWHDEKNVAGSKKLAYEKTKLLLERFRVRHGSTVCLRLLGVDFTTKDGADYAKQHDLFNVKCGAFVEDACQIVRELLQ